MIAHTAFGLDGNVIFDGPTTSAAGMTTVIGRPDAAVGMPPKVTVTDVPPAITADAATAVTPVGRFVNHAARLSPAAIGLNPSFHIVIVTVPVAATAAAGGAATAPDTVTLPICPNGLVGGMT